MTGGTTEADCDVVTSQMSRMSLESFSQSLGRMCSLWRLKESLHLPDLEKT